MATLTIRNVDEDLKATLRIRAAMHGKSMEEELRSILRQALIQPVKDGGLGTRLAKRFESFNSMIESSQNDTSSTTIRPVQSEPQNHNEHMGNARGESTTFRGD